MSITLHRAQARSILSRQGAFGYRDAIRAEFSPIAHHNEVQSLAALPRYQQYRPSTSGSSAGAPVKFNPHWPRHLTQLVAQLRTGVCGILGGVLHGFPEDCYRCNQHAALARGGLAVAHVFLCPAPSAVALRGTHGLEQQSTPRVLWTHPLEAAAYVSDFARARPVVALH